MLFKTFENLFFVIKYKFNDTIKYLGHSGDQCCDQDDLHFRKKLCSQVIGGLKSISSHHCKHSSVLYWASACLAKVSINKVECKAIYCVS